MRPLPLPTFAKKWEVFSSTNSHTTSSRFGARQRVADLGDWSTLFHRRELLRIQLVDVHIRYENGAVGALGKTIRLSTTPSLSLTFICFI